MTPIQTLNEMLKGDLVCHPKMSWNPETKSKYYEFANSLESDKDRKAALNWIENI